MPAVVFDLGKVLLDFNYGRAAENLSRHSRLDAVAIRKLIDQSPLLHRYETGLMRTEHFILEIRTQIGFTGSDELFSKLFADIFTPIEPMIELHTALQKKGFKTVIFSNTNELAIRHVREMYPFFNTFHDHILSYEHGSMKPHARLYEVVEEKTGASAGELIYIDDRPENIDSALNRGWQAILHTDHCDTLERLRRSGVA